MDRTLAKEFVDVFLAGEWIDMEHDDYDEGLSFEAPGGGDRSIQVSSDAVQSDFDILF